MTIERGTQAERLKPLPTEVIDQLSDFPRFFGEVIIVQHDPSKLKKTFVTGPAGVGKSTISSQLVIKMLESYELNSKAKASRRSLQVWHYPFDHALREKMQDGTIEVGWGGFADRDFDHASIHMSETIAGMKIVLAVKHPDIDPSMVVDLVGLTEARGALVVNTQFDLNSTLIEVLPDRSGEILRRSKEIRAALHNKKNSIEIFTEKLKEFKVITDLPITARQFQRLKTMMGNETSVDRVNMQLADIVVSLKPVLMEREYLDLRTDEGKLRSCPNFDRDSFLNDPGTMSDVLDFYSRYLVLEKWNLPRDKVLFAHNNVLNADINYYLSVLETIEQFRQ